MSEGEPQKQDTAIPPVDVTIGLKLRDLFRDRLASDGRLEMFDTKVKELMDSGVHRERAIHVTSKQFGRMSLEKERKEYRKRLAEKAVISLKRERFDDLELRRQANMEQSFEGALRLLPDTAPANVELRWIRAHPVMTRKNRSTLKDKAKPIVLGVSEILHSSVGPAPSKSAVHALQHWCNQPDDFFKIILAEQRKESTKANAAEEAAGPDDKGTAEIDALLGL
jgi:hypothetical protein